MARAQAGVSLARVRPELRWTDVHAQLLREKMERDQLVLEVVSRVHCLSKAQMAELMGLSAPTRFYSEPIKYTTGVRVWHSLGGASSDLPAPSVPLAVSQLAEIPEVSKGQLESPSMGAAELPSLEATAEPLLATPLPDVQRVRIAPAHAAQARSRTKTSAQAPERSKRSAYQQPTRLRWLGWSVALLLVVLCNVWLALSLRGPLP